jgi:hypothetical protein
MHSKETAIVISTYHRTFEGDGKKTILNFKNEKFKNFFILFDNSKQYTNEEISLQYEGASVCDYNSSDFEQLKLNRPISKFHRWGSHQNPNYFYAHHRMMIFFLKNPTFKYYWFFDDDVTFKGDLLNFINHYDDVFADFLAIQVFKKENYVDFPFVSQVNSNMGSGGNWLGFAPGPGDNYRSLDKHMGCFFPIVRFSNEAMNHLVQENEQDYFGYSEGFVPTTIASAGMSVASMLDEKDNYFHPSTNKCDIFHKGSAFTWTWI